MGWSDVCFSLTDGGAGDCWVSTVGGLGLHCGRPSFLCRVGMGGEGSLWTCRDTTSLLRKLPSTNSNST